MVRTLSGSTKSVLSVSVLPQGNQWISVPTSDISPNFRVPHNSVVLNKGCCCTDNVQWPALDMAGTVGATVGPQSPLNRNLERLLEEAQISGELRVSSRRLREFPKVANKYNLNDTVYSGK